MRLVAIKSFPRIIIIIASCASIGGSSRLGLCIIVWSWCRPEASIVTVVVGVDPAPVNNHFPHRLY